MALQHKLNKIEPRKLFLIDSLGGLLSAIMLGLILTRFENTFGMPEEVLYPLAFMACIFFTYSFICFLSKTANWRPYMKIIAITNLMYCCLTIVLIIYLYQKLTVLGLMYFILEIIVITVLAIVELKTAAHLMYRKA
ncbi:hypothetical protein D770_22905 [Flammeovirgaceae bacterium 311]|nr:hypothetical protein D770_22905 [Flammeovirgaceae bacterium 311]